MALPLSPPVLPQLARSAKTVPRGEQWVYEPKWDGFRCIAFVEGGDVHLQSRNGKPLTRYFPELAFPDGRFVLDGEIVIFGEGGRQDFRSEEHTSELQSRQYLVCRLLLEKKKKKWKTHFDVTDVNVK